MMTVSPPINQDTEASWGEVICPMSHSQGWECNPGVSDCKAKETSQ